MFERLCDVLGHQEWLSDPRLATAGHVERTEDIIRPAIEAWARDKTKLEASRLLAEAGVVAGPSNEPADVAADPHVLARGLVSAAAGLARRRPGARRRQPDPPVGASGAAGRAAARGRDAPGRCLPDLLGSTTTRSMG